MYTVASVTSSGVLLTRNGSVAGSIYVIAKGIGLFSARDGVGNTAGGSIADISSSSIIPASHGAWVVASF